MTIGTSVLTPTFRYHPGIVAQNFATLGCLFPGRVVLGIGSGESMNEVPLGVEWPEPKERFARLREAVALIRQLWTEDRVNFAGDYYQTHNATIYDKPEITGADLHRRVRARRPPATPDGSATATSRPAARTRSSIPTPCCRPCAKGPSRPVAR